MGDPSALRKEIMKAILNSKKLGDKKFHSETSLQKFGDEDEDKNTLPAKYNASDTQDPGVLNTSMNGPSRPGEIGSTMARKRALSQPGPVAGVAMQTAAAARAARPALRRPQRNVIYAPDLTRSESDRIPREAVLKADDSGTVTPTGNSTVSSTGDRGSPFSAPLYNSNYRNGDVKSLSSYRLYAPASERNFGTPRKRSVATMDAQSIRSMETQAPPPTDPISNKRLTKKYLTVIMSTIYAIILVTLGLIFHIADVFTTAPLSAVYSIILSVLGFSYLVYLMIDIGRYKKIALRNQKIKERYEDKLTEYFRKNEEDFNVELPGDGGPELYKPPPMPAPVLIPLKHHYCFSQGRHSGSFYLKLGAAAFALGSLVHSVLLIAEQLSFLFDDNINNEECVDYLQVALDIFYPVYCFVQLFFIFKYSNVIVIRAQGVARFAFMHMIGASLCFWVSVIVRETILALTLYAKSYQNGNYDNDDDSSSEEIFDRRLEFKFFNVSNLYDENCIGSAAVNQILESYSPYLYPFSVEFNILIVAVYYIIWNNIGHCANEDANHSENASDGDEENFSVCKIPTASEENDFTSNLVIHADCHASNRGLFMGLVVMVVIVGMLILGFVFNSIGGEYLSTGYLLNNITKLGLHSLMLFASIFAFIQTMKLDINQHPISLLDDILLFICLPPFVMETVFSLAATITIINHVRNVNFIIMMIQVLIQTPLIIDGLRRCSNTRKLRRTKPGREIIMFLIITNVAMWLFYTFSYKSPESLDERYAYYGKELWTILGHVSLPLIMFYRFHSSVCFADIWDSAYKPGSEH